MGEDQLRGLGICFRNKEYMVAHILVCLSELGEVFPHGSFFTRHHLHIAHNSRHKVPQQHREGVKSSARNRRAMKFPFFLFFFKKKLFCGVGKHPDWPEFGFPLTNQT